MMETSAGCTTMKVQRFITHDPVDGRRKGLCDNARLELCDPILHTFLSVHISLGLYQTWVCVIFRSESVINFKALSVPDCEHVCCEDSGRLFIQIDSLRALRAVFRFHRWHSMRISNEVERWTIWALIENLWHDMTLVSCQMHRF